MHQDLKIKITNFIMITVLVLCSIGAPIQCFAAPSDADIQQMEQKENETKNTISNLEKQTKETQNAINSLQNQKEQTQSNVNALKNKSADLQNTIDGYNSELSILQNEISETEAAMAEVSAQILELDTKIKETKEEEARQYALLKKQMQSTYESGGANSMLLLLISSINMQDFLTKNEYVTALVTYDQRKLMEYRELEKQLEEDKKLVEEKLAEMDSYQQSLDDKHEELAELTDAVMSNLDSTNHDIASEKGKLAEYDSQLNELDKKMKSLESQVAAAQAALAKQIAERQAALIAAGKTENLGGSYAATATELEWLAATIQAEAGGESYTSQLAVGSVIMNRVKSSSFPNTIVGVITQNMQFASYRSGKVELIISRGAQSSCIQAAKEVLAGARIGEYLFFMTKYYVDYYGITEYTMIDHQAFFCRWVTNKNSNTGSSTQTTQNTNNTDINNTTDSTEPSETDVTNTDTTDTDHTDADTTQTDGEGNTEGGENPEAVDDGNGTTE